MVSPEMQEGVPREGRCLCGCGCLCVVVVHMHMWVGCVGVWVHGYVGVWVYGCVCGCTCGCVGAWGGRGGMRDEGYPDIITLGKIKTVVMLTVWHANLHFLCKSGHWRCTYLMIDLHITISSSFHQIYNPDVP